ncbi:MAG: hypothetical protein AAB778_03785 [Patescibacteria group bacterium]
MEWKFFRVLIGLPDVEQIELANKALSLSETADLALNAAEKLTQADLRIIEQMKKLDIKDPADKETFMKLLKTERNNRAISHRLTGDSLDNIIKAVKLDKKIRGLD